MGILSFLFFVLLGVLGLYFLYLIIAFIIAWLDGGFL